jgi:hypothetical protein
MRTMRLPTDVLAAKAKMELADAALRADIESDGADPERRIHLIDELQMATDEYMDKIDRLRVRLPREFN